MKTAPLVTRAEHLASLVAAIGVTVGIALLVVAASGSGFVGPLALHAALDARRASEHLVYVTSPVPPPAVVPTRRAARPSARRGVPSVSTSPARQGMMAPPPDSASFAAAVDAPAATIPPAVSDTARRQVLRAAIPLGAPVAAATVGFTRRSSHPVRFDSVLRTVSDSIGIGLTLGVLEPPPLTQAEQDARWRAEAFEVAAARGAGVPLRRTMAGGSIPVPLPFGGPSRKQRERDRAIEAQLKVVRALRQRTVDSVVAARRQRRADSLSHVVDSLRLRTRPQR